MRCQKRDRQILFDRISHFAPVVLILQSVLLILPAEGKEQDPPSTTSSSSTVESKSTLSIQNVSESAGPSSQTDVGRGTKIPQLPEKYAKDVEVNEQGLDGLLSQSELPNDDAIKLIVSTAEEMFHLRQQYQGDHWWETLDARQRLTDLRKWLSFTASQRAELAAWVKLSKQVQTLAREGKYTEVLAPAAKLLDVDRRVWGEGHRRFAMSLNNLAWLHWQQGAYAQAEPLYKRGLSILEQALGPIHPDTATALNNLAALYQAQGAYTQAEPLYKRGWAMLEQALGPIHPDTATALNNLAALYQAQGAYTQAESFYERALSSREQVLGSTHPDTAVSLNNLAGLYRNQGRYAEAEPLYKRALAIREQALGPTHPNTAIGLNNLAELYRDQGQYAEAEALYKRALAIWEQVLGPAHPNTAIGLNNLASLYRIQGQYAKAEPLFERALAIREKGLGPEHPDTVVILNNLALLHRAQAQFDEALRLLERALAITEHALGPTHPATARVLQNLGILRSLSHSDEQAAELLLRGTRANWHSLTHNFPTLSAQQQQRFLAQSTLDVPDYFWHLFSALPRLDRRAGFEATLLSKQLLTEVARQESGVVQQMLATASPTWQALWRERQDLRRRYATQALQRMTDTMWLSLDDSTRGVATPPDPRIIVTRLEQLDRQLRRENPAYVKAARLEEITVEQVTQGLRPGQDALLEYVRFHPYDAKTKQLAETWHYGVYVLHGGTAPVVAVDLGDAVPIDVAIHQFQMGMKGVIKLFESGVTPSLIRIRKDEATLAKTSSTLRQLIWQPLESHLRNVTRVYVAPDGPLSQLPFEVLVHRTKQGAWRYLVEERELLYLNTGRDLARVGVTSETTQKTTTLSGTAVLVGNPAFQASPREVAAVVEGMSIPAPTVMQLKSRVSSPTLGAGSTEVAPRLKLPRTWQQVPSLERLLNVAGAQLTQAGWAVMTMKHKEAVEEAVLRLEAPRILQFATHGYLLDRLPTNSQGWDNPLFRSMLLMAGVNHADPSQAVFYRVGSELLSALEAQQRGLISEAEQHTRVDVGDGVLTAYEVTGMNLQGTDLVSLTACETGLGDVTPEGVAGLRQAFLLAGARALIVSMWEVPVEETVQQIRDFYQRWLGAATDKNGRTANPRYAAFHETQLAALNHARKTYGGGHPFFWAGFIYLGDPGDLNVRLGEATSAKLNKQKK